MKRESEDAEDRGHWSDWGLFAVFSVIVFLLWFATPFVVRRLVPEFGERGIAGDLYGSLNALFTGLAFAGLITTLILQQRELALQRKELALTREEFSGQRKQMELQNEQMRRQMFEATFFQMVTAWNDYIRDLHHKDGSGKIVTGRPRLSDIRSSLSYTASYGMKDTFYEDAFSKNRGILGPYVRLLFNIIALIDASKEMGKQRYADIVKAYLTDDELVLLAIILRTEYGSQFVEPERQYDLLEHCPNNWMLQPGPHKSWIE